MTNLPEEIKKQIEEKYPLFEEDKPYKEAWNISMSAFREAAQWGYGLRGKEDLEPEASNPDLAALAMLHSNTLTQIEQLKTTVQEWKDIASSEYKKCEYENIKGQYESENFAYSLVLREINQIIADLQKENSSALTQMEQGWIKLEDFCEMPDYDERVLWFLEDGNMIIEDLDKDGNPWLLGSDNEEWPMPKATHWRPLPLPPMPNNEQKVQEPQISQYWKNHIVEHIVCGKPINELINWIDKKVIRPSQQNPSSETIYNVQQLFDSVIFMWKDPSNEMDGLYTLETLKKEILGILTPNSINPEQDKL